MTVVRHGRCTIGVCLLLAGFYSQAVHAEIALTSDEVATRVRATNATVGARRAEVEAAQAAVSEAQIALWPRLAAFGFYARYSPISAPTVGNVVFAASPGPVDANNMPAAVPLRFSALQNSIGAQLGLTIPVSDYLFRFPYTVGATKQSVVAAEAQVDATGHLVTSDARSLYYAWARAVLQKDAADVAVTQARAHLELAHSRQGAGTTFSTEAIHYESQLANSELLAHRLSHLIDLLADQLRTAMHDTRTGPYTVGEKFDPPTDDAAALEFEDCYQKALSQRDELRSLAASAESEEQQARAARAAMYPRLELYGHGLASNPNPRYVPVEDKFHLTWEVGGRLSYSPNELAAGRTQAQQHRARAQSLGAQRQQMMESIRDEILAAVQARQESLLAWTAATKSLALADDTLRVRRSLLAEGRATHVEVTDAETERVRAQFAEVDAKIDAKLASVRLERAIGSVR